MKNNCNTYTDKCILVVDDDEISRLVASEILAGCGAAVDCAATSEDAVRMVGTNRYDLIILDLHMPGMSGMELARTMTALDASLQNRIILITALEDDELALAAEHADGFRIYAKPLDPAKALEHLPQTTPFVLQTRSAGTVRPAIEGIKIDSGLDNFLGQEEAYYLTLRAFPDYSSQFIADFTRHLEATDVKECRRLAHSLKGSSAMIGATEIHEQASAMESLCRTHDAIPGIAEPFQHLKKQLLRVSESIQKNLQSRQHRPES